MTSWALLLLVVAGAFDAPFPSAVSAARGGPSVAIEGAEGASEGNPALASDGRWGAGTDWTRPLGLDGLDLLGAWLGTPGPGRTGSVLRWRSMTAGEVYREDQVGWDFATAWRGLRLGAGPRWSRVEVAGREQGAPWGWAAGLACEPIPGWSAGAAWEDPSGIATRGLPMPWTLRAGGGWRSADSSWISEVAASRGQISSWSWSLGQEWRWEPIRFRMGLRTDPLVVSLGLGARWRSARIDWGAETESRFGWQHHLGISWGI